MEATEAKILEMALTMAQAHRAYTAAVKKRSDIGQEMDKADADVDKKFIEYQKSKEALEAAVDAMLVK